MAAAAARGCRARLPAALKQRPLTRYKPTSKLSKRLWRLGFDNGRPARDMVPLLMTDSGHERCIHSTEPKKGIGSRLAVQQLQLYQSLDSLARTAHRISFALTHFLPQNIVVHTQPSTASAHPQVGRLTHASKHTARSTRSCTHDTQATAPRTRQCIPWQYLITTHSPALHRNAARCTWDKRGYSAGMHMQQALSEYHRVPLVHCVPIDSAYHLSIEELDLRKDPTKSTLLLPSMMHHDLRCAHIRRTTRRPDNAHRLGPLKQKMAASKHHTHAICASRRMRQGMALRY
jgi:hypothetical protein